MGARTDLEAVPPTLPRNFDHWNGPWEIGNVSWLVGDFVGDDTVWAERSVWLRSYQEQSHCGTSGCCELDLVVIGPFVSGIRVMDTDKSIPQPGVPTMNLLVAERPGWQDLLGRFNPFNKAHKNPKDPS